jgi:hypothetical protein
MCAIQVRVRDYREGWPLLKLRKIGTQRVQLKGILPRLVRWALHVGTREFCPALAALVGPVQNIFPHCTLFQFICLYRLASWAAIRAGPPVP